MKPLRLLIVEDDARREKKLLSWLPVGFRAVVARSAGQAIGTIQRDPGRVYAGLVLDHDLVMQPRSGADQGLDGKDVVRAVVQHIDPEVLVLVHSLNLRESPAMVASLQSSGFEVTKIPMDVLTPALFQRWLEQVQENWEE